MRALIWISLSILLASCASHKASERRSFQYTDQVFTSAAFIPHDEKGAFKSYLAMNLPYPGFEHLLKELETAEGKTLKNRGEAHITVITPPEFDKILSKKIAMKDINHLAEQMQIQATPFRPLCIGKVTAPINNSEQAAYFVVIDSEKLFKLRKAIQDLYVAKGGTAADFNPELFFPHVTLGYTERDLHYEDGVKKDASACIINLEPGPHAK